MGKSRGFGSTATNLCALLRLGFPTASQLNCLTLLATITRRFILQKARRHASCALRLLVSIRFQVLFHSPPGVLFTFPSRYWFTIGRQGVFSLRGWSPQIPTGFHVSRGTWDTLRSSALSPTGVLPPMPGLSRPLRLKLISLCESPTTPSSKFELRCSRFDPGFPFFELLTSNLQLRGWFGLFRVRSPLLTESLLFSFPPGT